MRRLRSIILVPVLTGAVALAGCGGDDAPSPSSSAKAPPASTPTTGSGSAPTATTAKAKSGPQQVEIKDFDYAPKKLSVAVGTKVTWTNEDSANHTVTFDSGSKKDLGSQAKGAKVSMTFAKAGSFAYHCDFHPNMHGTIVVR